LRIFKHSHLNCTSMNSAFWSANDAASNDVFKLMLQHTFVVTFCNKFLYKTWCFTFNCIFKASNINCWSLWMLKSSIQSFKWKKFEQEFPKFQTCFQSIITLQTWVLSIPMIGDCINWYKSPNAKMKFDVLCKLKIGFS
jgi:hypothetical protein